MQESWVNALREGLAAKKSELEQRLSRINANIRRTLDSDSKERAAELENQEVVDALGIEATQQVAEIAAALARIKNGTFGNCEACAEPISKERLMARPHARKCIDCASLDER